MSRIKWNQDLDKYLINLMTVSKFYLQFRINWNQHLYKYKKKPIVLSVQQITASDYPFGIFKLVLTVSKLYS
jgi:hypothetical protein